MITTWYRQHGHDIARWYEEQTGGGTDLYYPGPAEGI
jgi:hypothetical protein